VRQNAKSRTPDPIVADDVRAPTETIFVVDESSPPSKTTSRIPSFGLRAHRASPRSEGGDGSTSSGAMAAEKLREKITSPRRISIRIKNQPDTSGHSRRHSTNHQSIKPRISTVKEENGTR